MELGGIQQQSFLKGILFNCFMAKKKAVEAAEPETSDETKVEKVVELKKPKNPVLGILAGERVITESSDDARDFFNQSRFGTLNENGKI